MFGAQDAPVELLILHLVLAEVALRAEGRADERASGERGGGHQAEKIATRTHQQSPLRAKRRGPGHRPRAARVGRTRAATDETRAPRSRRSRAAPIGPAKAPPPTAPARRRWRASRSRAAPRCARAYQRCRTPR